MSLGKVETTRVFNSLALVSLSGMYKCYEDFKVVQTSVCKNFKETGRGPELDAFVL